MTEEMSLQDMLTELLRFYPILNRKKEDIARDMVTYRELILRAVYDTNKKYDWDKCLKHIQSTRTQRTFPAIADIIAALPYSVKYENLYQEKHIDPKEGALLVITLVSGLKYAFTFSGWEKSVSELKKHCKERFGDCEIKLYPKGTVLIGNEVVEP